MPFNELLKSVRKLLSKNGKFCVVVPFESEDKLVEMGKENTLFCDKILRVRGKKNSVIKRSLMAFSFEKNPVKVKEIYLEVKRHVYSKDFINLTKEFYLKF
jgi:tRNA1Val (adenine37-N6)-methyltransferase